MPRNADLAQLRFSRLRSLLTRIAFQLLLAVATLIIPSIFTLTLHGDKDLMPLISFSYLLAVTVAAWFGGFSAGVVVIVLSLFTLTGFATGGKSFIPPRFDYAALAVLVMLAAMSSSTAKARRRAEEVLRRANRELEDRVRERTAELQRAREWLQTTLVCIGDGVLATDREGKISFLNPVAEQLTGWSTAEATGHPAEEIFVIVNETNRETVPSPVAQVLQTGNAVALANHTVLLARDSREIPIADSATPIRTPSGEMIGVVVIFRDITARRRAEQERDRMHEEVLKTQERLRETAKLESLGVLAGGIAHDFNNLLVGVLGNASLAQEILSDGNEVSELLDDLMGAAEKASLLTRQLLAYAGKGKFVIEPLNLSHMVNEILPLLNSSISSTVTVRAHLASQLPPIDADKAQIQQVLMNLIINGAEACGERPGAVSIVTRTERIRSGDLPPAFGLPAVEPGLFVCVEVKDTGAGMSEETLAKIFDPFFTTKFTGRGLGLSAVLGIIRAHHGAIRVKSALGAGTTFQTYFPVSTAAVSGAEEPQRIGLDGTGTILVVDDEEIVRRVAKSTLERFGYRVLLAEDGHAGVQIYRASAADISAVLLDLTMPALSGDAALSQLQQIDPGVKVILSSGYTVSEAHERFSGKGLCGFLQKPYTAAELCHAIRIAVDGTQASQSAS